MKGLLILVVFVAITIGALLQANKPVEVSGKAWVTVQAGTALPLSEVPIRVFHKDRLYEHFWERRSDYVAHRPIDELRLAASGPGSAAQMDALAELVEAEKHSNPTWWLEGGPRPVASTDTDANGDFTVSVPRGDKYVIVAWAQRRAGDLEQFFWAVDVDRRSDLRLTANNARPWGDYYTMIYRGAE